MMISINKAIESDILTVSALTVRLESGSFFSMENRAVPRLNKMMSSRAMMIILKSIHLSVVKRCSV